MFPVSLCVSCATDDFRRRYGSSRSCSAWLLFALYAIGASRTIYVGDSGELVAAVATLGIPHPTGYPLYVLLGKLWTLLVPIGSIAFRMSLMSAACAGAAAGGLYALARWLGLDRIPAVFAALLLAFAPSFWAEANIQRVYALNAMLLVAALAAAARWHRDRAPAAFVLTFFIAGLGATNHTFMGFFAIAFAISAVVREPRVLREVRLLATAFAATVAGLLVYAYLPLRSRMDPALDWGKPGDPQRLSRRRAAARLLAAPLLGRSGRHLSDRSRLSTGTRQRAVLGRRCRSRSRASRWRGGAAGRSSSCLLTAAANVTSMAMHGSRSDLFIWHRYYIPVLRGDGAARRAGLPGSVRAAGRSPGGAAAPGAGAAARAAGGDAGGRLSAQRPQPLPHRRGLQPLPARDAPARRAPDGERRQHSVRPHLPEPGREGAARRRPGDAGRRRLGRAAAPLRSGGRPALPHPPPELDPARARDRPGRSRLPRAARRSSAAASR